MTGPPNASGNEHVSQNSANMVDPQDLPFWKRSHYLDRMTLKQLIVAYFQHYTIMSYLSIAALSVVFFAFYPAGVWQTLGAIAAAVLVYPLVWHLLHQYVLHSRWMWKHKLLAPTWKRIHYDHHQDPNDLSVLFGALHTTVPTVAIATIPVGWLIGGPGGAAAAFATGILTTCYYEFMHCIQHLAFKPKWKWVQHMKQRHNEHHYFDEDGNFGITNYLWDRVLGTYYIKKDRKKRSATVFNLGYDEDVALRYPYVKDLSGGIASGHPRRRVMGKEGQQPNKSDDRASA
ncbi:fatty acid hydroxylase family protein [Altererythrobacter endophyticus]|uniref:Fatty acid hydroxylase family protein n=2 Tax=Altericroceibacterium endophyticum TaxID=1808508 RepID=A0A6I4T552_9SPHN|nr:fatty acid hydroxylase family protein [Altericroceibacterium endophyticum]